MSGYWLYVVRGAFLLASIYLISYVMATPGPQGWQAAVGGALGMMSITLQWHQDLRQ